MRYIVDTCGWLEWLTEGKLTKFFEPYLKHLERLFIPTIVQYELYKWICREKDEVLASEIIGITEQGIVLPLDSQTALYAAEIFKEHKLAMADAIVYATSLLNHADLITSDKHLKDLPKVKYFEKA